MYEGICFPWLWVNDRSLSLLLKTPLLINPGFFICYWPKSYIHLKTYWCGYCSHVESTWAYSMKSFQNKFSHVRIVALVLKGMNELKSDPNENTQIYMWLYANFWASLVAQPVKNQPSMQETRAWSVGQGDSLGKGMATHSSILAWRIPLTEEPGGLQSMGLWRVRYDWVTNTRTHTNIYIWTKDSLNKKTESSFILFVIELNLNSCNVSKMTVALILIIILLTGFYLFFNICFVASKFLLGLGYMVRI